jgi:putative membrane protein
MHRQDYFAAIAVVATLLCTGCVGPAGAGFGLGPEWDQLSGLLLFACVGVVLYWLLRRSPLFDPRRPKLGSLPGSAACMEEAERIVRQRYARGEIGREEYLEKLNDLGTRPA